MKIEKLYIGRQKFHVNRQEKLFLNILKIKTIYHHHI